MKSNNQAVVYAGLAVVSWSTIATALKIALSYQTHFEMLLVASSTALLFFICLMTVQRKWKEVRKLSLKQWRYFAGIGLLNPVAYYLALFKAYDLLPAQIAQPINYAWPIVLLLLLAIFAHQPIPSRKYIGMFISLGGVVLITMGSSQTGKTVSAEGIILAALSAVLWASYWLLSNQQREVGASTGLFMTFLFGTVYLTVAACMIGIHNYTLAGLFSGMYVGCFEIAIPFILFGMAMRKSTNPALINQMCYLSPFLSLFFITLILKEQIAITTYIGLSLIVGGILYNQYFIKRIYRKPGKLSKLCIRNLK